MNENDAMNEARLNATQLKHTFVVVEPRQDVFLIRWNGGYFHVSRDELAAFAESLRLLIESVEV